MFKAYSEAYLEPCQTSKMERFAKIVNGQGPEYASLYQSLSYLKTFAN